MRLNSILAIAATVLLLVSCSKTETYQEKRDKEIAAINSFIAEKGIKVISEETFFAQDSMTDATKNEYVLFEASGVYMQIVRKGCGQKLRKGETATVLCRFSEYNLKLGADSLSLSNEFYIKNQGRKWRNRLSCTALAITEVIRNEEAILCTFLHELKAFCPASNNLVQRECSCLTTIV